MKYTTLLVAIFTSAVAAGVVEQRGAMPPACAIGCVKKNIKGSGCTLLDFKCSCQSESLFKAAMACAQKECTEKEVTESKKWVDTTCKKVLAGGKP